MPYTSRCWRSPTSSTDSASRTGSIAGTCPGCSRVSGRGTRVSRVEARSRAGQIGCRSKPTSPRGRLEAQPCGGDDMRMMIHRGAVLCLALALAACGDDDDDGFNPTMDDVAGSYTASAFTLTSGNGEFDLLAFGANVTAVLNTDGTTTGRLQVPGGVAGAPAIDEDLAGSWSLSGTTVRFTPSESSLLTD